jgi:bis(5'-nucleosyl)-tetraphosphatase (symmetrical)
VTVLGNHDLYLLMVAYGAVRSRGKDDTIQAVLDAPDREALLGWLRTRPLMHVENGFAMVHAGLLPGWTVTQARALAREVEGALAGPTTPTCSTTCGAASRPPGTTTCATMRGCG